MEQDQGKLALMECSCSHKIEKFQFFKKHTFFINCSNCFGLHLWHKNCGDFFFQSTQFEWLHILHESQLMKKIEKKFEFEKTNQRRDSAS